MQAALFLEITLETNCSTSFWLLQPDNEFKSRKHLWTGKFAKILQKKYNINVWFDALTFISKFSSKIYRKYLQKSEYRTYGLYMTIWLRVFSRRKIFHMSTKEVTVNLWVSERVNFWNIEPPSELKLQN